jgi:hypothetical protein
MATTGPDGVTRRWDRATERTLRRDHCSICKQCWIYEDTGKCIYGGPYDGYVKVPDPTPDQEKS